MAVVVWDWDWSAVNENTDTYVPISLSPATAAFIRENANRTPWTVLMATAARAMHAEGVTRAQIEDTLRRLPVDAAMLANFAIARQFAAAVHVLSDANTVYIETIAAHRSILQHITSITTNHAHFEETGLLVISPYTPADRPHGCPRCPPNLCKGREMDRLWGKHGERGSGGHSPTFYVGDGSGDLCACLRLGAGDVVCAREGYPLLKALTQHRPAFRGKVVAWKNGGDVQRALLEFRAGLQQQQRQRLK